MDEKERKSCIFTIKTLMNLAYNIHGVMDVVDVENCKKIIEMLGSGYLAGRWIPVSERLPEERGLYLTTTKNKEVYCDYWNEDNFDRTEMVIAWMPLPEPYQEGEQE